MLLDKGFDCSLKVGIAWRLRRRGNQLIKLFIQVIEMPLGHWGIIIVVALNSLGDVVERIKLNVHTTENGFRFG